MFKFFKDKLKSWLGKSKEEIEKKEEVEEKVEETEEKKVLTEEKPVKTEEVEKEELKEELKELEKQIKKKPEKEEKTEEIEPISREAPTFEEIEGKKEEKPSIFQRLKEKFSYKLTEENFEEIFESLEMLLLENNVALEAVEAIKKQLKEELVGKDIKKQNLELEIKTALKKAIENLLIEPDNILETVKLKQPFVIVFFGINGGGKTTTISKVAALLLKNKISCVLAASDTFRAASIEQLQMHADKLKIKLIKHDYGADPSAVAFDAIKHAKAHGIEVVLIDTAGRMHTKENLLSEMEKICRVTKPDLKIFVGEAITGNDMVSQCKTFNEAIGIDGIILSKADIDEKGGAILSAGYITHKPIFYLGTGQNYEDLEVFNPKKVLEKLGL